MADSVPVHVQLVCQCMCSNILLLIKFDGLTFMQYRRL